MWEVGLVARGNQHAARSLLKSITYASTYSSGNIYSYSIQFLSKNVVTGKTIPMYL